MGSFDVTVQASDGSTTGAASFVWHVGAGLILELINPGPQVDAEGDKVFLVMQVVLNGFPAPGAIQFSAVNLPGGLQISRSTGAISGQIRHDAEGVYDTTVTVTENGARPISQTFQWTVRSHRSR